MQVSVIAFDLDGTLIDSNPMKRRGFDHVFAEFKDGPEIVARVLETHRKAFRTVVIRLVLAQLHAVGALGCEPTDERVFELAARYNRFCIDGASTCPAMPGVDAMLPVLARLLPLYVNTATAHEAVGEVLRRRNWSGHFTRLFGFPPGKVENLRAIAADARISCDSLLLIGDDDQDFLAAEECGCPFIGIVSPHAHFSRVPSRVITDFKELPAFLERCL